MQTETTKVGEDGSLIIPAPYREALGLKAGETVTMVMDEDGLHIQNMRQAIARSQAIVRKYISADRMLSEELIVERREEVRRELAGG